MGVALRLYVGVQRIPTKQPSLNEAKEGCTRTRDLRLRKSEHQREGEFVRGEIARRRFGCYGGAQVTTSAGRKSHTTCGCIGTVATATCDREASKFGDGGERFTVLRILQRGRDRFAISKIGQRWQRQLHLEAVFVGWWLAEIEGSSGGRRKNVPGILVSAGIGLLPRFSRSQDRLFCSASGSFCSASEPSCFP